MRSFPEVDPERIGVTGISWGGYLTCIVAGVDHRFQFAVPVYGCGYLGENSALAAQLSKRWGRKRPAAGWSCGTRRDICRTPTKPMLWVNGTNDFAYPMDSWQKSYRLRRASQVVPACPHAARARSGRRRSERDSHLRELAAERGAIAADDHRPGPEQDQAWITYESKMRISKPS